MFEGRSKANHIWTPHPGSQQQFLRCPADECLLHGSRGGGKTDSLLMDFLQHVGCGYGPDWRGILFREEYTQLTDVINKSKKWVSQIFPGAKYNGSDHRWTFPDGEELYLRYMRSPSDYWGYHGHEYPWCVSSDTKVLMADGTTKAAHSVGVGNKVQTLEGPCTILKTHKSIKPCVKVSFFDASSQLIGEQIQGEGHRILSAYGLCNGLIRDSYHTNPKLPQTKPPWFAYTDLHDLYQRNQQVSLHGKNLKNQLELYRHLPIAVNYDEVFSYLSQTLLQFLLHMPHFVLETYLNNVPFAYKDAAPIFHLPCSAHTNESTTTYTHPYSGLQRHQSENFVPEFGTPLFSTCGYCEVIDLTVDTASHYITKLETSQVSCIDKKFVVNMNCGWEELTNWATDECYMPMMSTNRSSNPDVPRKIRATCNPSGPGHCVPYGEVLTTTGWKDIAEMQVGDTVFTVRADGTMEEGSVSQVHSEWYTGPLRTLNMRGTHLSCTPNHKLPKVVDTVDNRETKFSLLEFDNLPGQVNVLRTVKWEGLELPKTFTVPEYKCRKCKLGQPDTIPMNKYIALVGWVLSEGEVSHRATDKSFSIAKIKTAFPEAYSEIENLLDSCGFLFKKFPTGFQVYSPKWWSHFNSFGSCTEKHVPEYIKNATVPELKILFSSLMRGDGSWKKHNKEADSGSYWTTSPQLASDVTEIALKLGFRVQNLDGKRSHLKLHGYSVVFRSAECTSFYTGNHRHNVSSTSVRKDVVDIDFDGKVYCIGVSGTHTFILRQKGSVWISGNSWVKRRFIDAGPPLKAIVDPKSGKVRTHIISSLEENLTFIAADPGYQRTIIESTQDDPLKYKAWVLGSWDIVSGGFFSDIWDSNIHILPYFQIPRTWYFFRSFDWGSAKPWSVSYIAESNGEQPTGYSGLPYFPKGTVIVFQEIYGWDGTPDKGDMATSGMMADRILTLDDTIEREFRCKVHPGPADNSIFDVRDGTSLANSMARYGLHWRTSYKGAGSRIAGWGLIRTMLGAVIRKDLENPHLYFSESARHHIRTISTLQHDKNRPEDVDSSGEDHCGDSLRYGLVRKLNSLQHRRVRH